jgi:hypothetical protein
MTIDIHRLRTIFDLTLDKFFACETEEVLGGVNERNNCARMSLYMQHIADANNLQSYFADAEYNRMQDGKVKTILDGEYKVVTINCDLILHSRGREVSEDNLIAVEVKKREAKERDKSKDRERLRAMTKASYDGVWANDGITHPEHVCGYGLGVYVEIDRLGRSCLVEYYRAGEKVDYRVQDF